MAGVDREVGDRLWRALGFPDYPEGVLVSTEEDARALRLAAQGLERLEGTERDHALRLILQEARILSAHLAAFAEAEIDALVELGSLGLRQEVFRDAFENGVEHSDLGWLIFFVLRRELNAAIRRRTSAGDLASMGREELSVAFIDLAGFTELTERAALDDVAEVLNEFEALSFDVVAEAHGRVVKLIGDEVMFVCPDPRQGAHACLEILEGAEASLPPARAALAHGTILRKGGDYFGRTVNRASRINHVADPGSLLVDELTRGRLIDDPELEIESFGQQHLKGLGTVPLWRVSPALGRN